MFLPRSNFCADRHITQLRLQFSVSSTKTTCGRLSKTVAPAANSPRLSWTFADRATSNRAVENQFYGDRSGQFEDPFGHRWNVSTHVEDVPPDEMAKRAAAMAGG